MRRRTAVTGAVVLLVVAALVTTAVAAFPARTVGRVASGPIRLPRSFEPSVSRFCLSDLGTLTEVITAPSGDPARADGIMFTTQLTGGRYIITIASPGSWVVEASRRGVTATGSKVALGGSDAQQASQAVAIAQRLYACLSQYEFVDGSTPYASNSQLVQQYKYDSLVLWPCLRARGLNVGPGPSRADFSDPFRAQAVDPFGELDVTQYSLRRLVAAVRACPLRPSYLH
jgi:hypothetical protein